MSTRQSALFGHLRSNCFELMPERVKQVASTGLHDFLELWLWIKVPGGGTTVPRTVLHEILYTGRGHGPSRVLQPQASGQTSLLIPTLAASTLVLVVSVVFEILPATEWQTLRKRKRQRNLQLPRRGYVASGNPCSVISPAAS